MANEQQPDSDPGFHRDITPGGSNDPAGDRKERRLFWELGLTFASLAELFGSYARDRSQLSDDQQAARLLAIATKLEHLREEIERTRLAARDLAVEKMNRLPTT